MPIEAEERESDGTKEEISDSILHDLVKIRDKLLENKVKALARAGAIAPLSVTIPAQNFGLYPETTSFFQALSIPTKISKSTIEIINDVHILKPGDKV
ncbi:unnamed protein product [Diabrotica balteata]|uniref:Large ribosomal subunit protein uL10 n=1 Tax=Diabrotica balteata TaxID=107213 RepID=A0A9N9XDQ7_DIABA|nr:unnamed protein product [Diabrotica balteata]